MSPDARVLLLLVALFCALAFLHASETALLSLGHVVRQRLLHSERRGERLVVALLARPRRLLVTFLIGIQFGNIAAVSLFADWLAGRLAALGPALSVGAGAVVWAAGALLLFAPLLILACELVPKTLAYNRAERWAIGSAWPLWLFAGLVAPLRLLVRGVSDLALSAFGGGSGKSEPEQALREEEFRALVDRGSEQGELDPAERSLIHKVFEFGDRKVGEIMTPMSRIFAVPSDQPLARVVESVRRNRFSRVPVYRGRRDHIVGILLAKDILTIAHPRSRGGAAVREPASLRELLRTPFFVPKTTKCDMLFREFQRRRTHLALVVDEYGRTVGLATMDDLLQELFGEIAAPPEGTEEGARDEARAWAAPEATGERPAVAAPAAHRAVAFETDTATAAATAGQGQAGVVGADLRLEETAPSELGRAEPPAAMAELAGIDGSADPAGPDQDADAAAGDGPDQPSDDGENTDPGLRPGADGSGYRAPAGGKPR